MGARAIFRGFNRPSRVLMINQFGINIGFYMLMPYLADYLAGPLGLAAWAVGLVMGVRNFSQQGMFFVGGTLADRFGYKPLIIAGCLIRTGGFALLVVAQSLPSVLIAAAATGFAGALFNPAVRGYLAAEAGERKIEAFAMFNVFYQSGILLGPLVGLVLLALDFRITVLAAAGVFGLLTVAQLVALPQHRADSEREKTSILQDWRVVVRNRPFLTLAAAMTGCYALSFQIYLALPMQASILMPRNQYLLIAAMFAVSGLVAVGGAAAHHPLVRRQMGGRAQPGSRRDDFGGLVHPGCSHPKRPAVRRRRCGHGIGAVGESAGGCLGSVVSFRNACRGRTVGRSAGGDPLRVLQHHRGRRSPRRKSGDRIAHERRAPLKYR